MNGGWYLSGVAIVKSGPVDTRSCRLFACHSEPCPVAILLTIRRSEISRRMGMQFFFGLLRLCSMGYVAVPTQGCCRPSPWQFFVKVCTAKAHRLSLQTCKNVFFSDRFGSSSAKRQSHTSRRRQRGLTFIVIQIIGTYSPQDEVSKIEPNQ